MRCVFPVAIVAAVASWPMPTIAASAVRSGTTFPCTAVAVWDGDGPIWCAEGPRIRLAGVAARELDGSCRLSHPCPVPSGVVARNTLVGLLGGPRGTLATGHVKVAAVPLRCVSQGDGRGGRTAAWCVAPRVGDLSCALVGAGVALRWDRYWRDGHCAEVTGRAVQARARYRP